MAPLSISFDHPGFGPGDFLRIFFVENY